MSGLIPCGVCGSYWGCTCNQTFKLVPVNPYPNTAVSGWTYFTATQGLSDDDVDKVAKRVVELLKEAGLVKVP